MQLSLFLFVLPLLLIIPICQAAPVSAFNLQTLIKNSDVVGVVEVQEMKLDYETKSPSIVCTLLCKPLIIYKGEISLEKIVIEGLHLSREATASSFLLVFIKTTEEPGKYLLWDGYNGAIPVGEARPPRAETVYETVEQEILLGLNSKEAHVLEPSLRILGHMGSKEGINKIIDMSRTSKNNAVVSYGLTYRLKENDLSVIGPALKYINEASTDTEKMRYLGQVCWAFADITKPEAVSKLNPLMEHKSPFLREPVATALSNIQDKTSIPWLIKGLDSSNRDAQYRCILGLSRIVGKKGPSRKSWTEFHDDPDFYIKEWKQWWKENSEED